MIAPDRRAERRMEARIASIAHKHVHPEHVQSAIKSIAISMSRHVCLEDVHPDHLTNEMIAGYMTGHAARHPRRAVPPTAPERPASIGFGHVPGEQLAHRQDAAARRGIEEK